MAREEMLEGKYESKYKSEYKKLNKAQKEAVDTMDGPVMVVAGPGTGKTQILALRIGNILLKTDIKSDGILCLTFTNSAVDSMKDRLHRYIGPAAEKVNVYTFHSFGMKIIEEYYSVLGLEKAPKLLDDIETILIFDEVLDKNSWKYLKPRGDRSKYFRDLKSLISLLKRERLNPKDFLIEVEGDIEKIKKDPENLLSRGENKGELKKEILNKIDSLGRSREAAIFFQLYEETKVLKNVLDYDDVLVKMVEVMEKSMDALADTRERYLYVLVDEHQDSSRVQNEFLKAVWGDVGEPNLFVVGDDRQLIYGFSGASVDHFQGFKKTWGSAKLITLIDNYRSTQVILDASHALLQSVMTTDKLKSQSTEHHQIRLVEGRDKEEEIREAALDIKEKIKQGISINNCAILVPKNSEVWEAMGILHGCGLRISGVESLNLFEQAAALEFIRVLKIITDPNDRVSFAASFLDSISKIPVIKAHAYLTAQKMREFSLAGTLENPSLFGADEISTWTNKLDTWSKLASKEEPEKIIKMVAEELPHDSNSLVSGEDIARTLTNLFLKEKEKNSAISLREFAALLSRLESYGEYLSIEGERSEGVKVMTLHSAKGLEFDYVWIAHMNERGLDSGKRLSFSLPAAIEEKIIEKDLDRHKRKLYVAITRARKFCNISYSRGENEDGPAQVIQDLPKEVIEKIVAHESEVSNPAMKNTLVAEIIKLVKDTYTQRAVSVSSLNNFFECPHKWYFKNLLGLPEVENENLIFGSRVHAAIDKILKTGKVTQPEDSEIAALVTRWTETRFPEISSERENEHPVSFRDKRFPHLNIFGRVDLIEKLQDGTLRITDFKTGRPKKKGDIAKLTEEGRLSDVARQLAMYSYLLENSPKWGNIKVSGSRLEFLEAVNPKEKIYDHIPTKEERELLLQDIHDFDKAIREGTWIDQECLYNSYGKNTECPYCKMAEIYKS